MKPEELKLYNKYYNVNNPNRELIYIGIDQRDGEYIFIYEIFDDNYCFQDYCCMWGINYDILNNLIDLTRKNYVYYSEKFLVNLKPCLKDKLKNIINR